MSRFQLAKAPLTTLVAALLLGACGGDKLPDLVQLPTQKPAALFIKGVTILDVENGKLSADSDVLVVGDKITRVAASGQIDAPADAQEIDGRGATLLPGLIDMHAHLGNPSAPRWVGEIPNPARNMQAYLYSGVTTVFETGALENHAFKRRDQVAKGELPGPRIFTTGPMMTATGGHPVAVLNVFMPWWIRWYMIPRYTRQVDTPEQARTAVREIAGLGGDAIKLMVDRIPEQAPRIQREVLQAAVAEAQAQKLRAVAHIGSTDDAIAAAEAGVALWVHGVYKERIPDDQIKRLAAFKIPMVPTLVVFDGYALLGRGPRVSTPLERETVSADVLGAFDNPPQTKDSEFFRPYLQQLFLQRQAARDNVRRLHAAGVTILAGSDTQAGVFPGAGLHRELHLLQESGLTPAQAIRAATSDAARYLANGQEPEFGIVAEGKQADLLLVEGNPLENLEALAKIRRVIKGGVALERRALARSQ